MFQAIQRNCRVDAGYVGLKNVWRAPDEACAGEACMDPANMDDCEDLDTSELRGSSGNISSSVLVTH